jgi:hypothetical protein
MNYNSANYPFIYGWQMREMKTKLLVLLSILVIAAVAMVMPVSAVGSVANITGNPQDFISIYETGDISGWNFIQDYLNVNTTSCTLNVTSNHLGWTVGVSDANLTTPTPGHMTEWDPSGQVYVGDKNLTHAMQMDGVTIPTQYTATPVTLNGVSQVIWKGVSDPQGIGTWPLIPITFRQQVDNADQHLLVPDVYRIVVTFTAGLP